MKKLTALLVLIILCSAGIHAQILRPFGIRYSNASVRGNIVYVSNNIVTSPTASNSEAPPGGTGVNNGNTAAYIDADGDASVIMTYGSIWKYLDNNTRPANWNTTGYSDAAWASGNAELGYGDGDESTIVSYGSDANNKYISTYFRKTINIVNPSLYSSFTVNMKRDDGVVLYLNGTEVHRSNMPGGAPAHATLASSNIDGAAELVTFTIPTASFVAGNNVFAAEVHQSGVTSTDISFDMELKVNAAVIPYASTWFYSNTNVEPAGWPNLTTLPGGSGAGPLGFGETLTTTLTDRKTYYFVRSFTITDLTQFSNFTFNLNYDDGAVVFVNGTEVGRINMAAGDPDFTTNALSNGENETGSFTVAAASPFVVGTNYVQVEVHSSGDNEPGTDDLRFDLELVGTYPNNTFSSSAAAINLASCSHVLWAGLYWGASQGTNGTNTTWITGETSVKLKLPGATNYQTITSTQTDYHNGTLVPTLPHTGYRAFADITSLLNTTNPNGLYYVADVVGPNGIVNGCGGWTIVIAYSNPNEAPRNLTVFDGSVVMNGGDPSLKVPISGFLTPPVGPVSCELGAVVYDGDRVSLDSFAFKQNSDPNIGSYTNMTPNATSNLNDMWNSTISYKGSVVTSRFPAHSNTLGYDADIIEVPNASNVVLGNNQTSASIKIGSPSENYFIHVITTSISVYSPSFALEKGSSDLNGGSLVGGDMIRYTINYQNVGNDASSDTKIIDNIPVATSFVPGSIRIGGVAKTDAAGDDQAEYDFVNRRVVIRVGTGANTLVGGSVATLVSGTVTFDVYAASACNILSCGTPTDNVARMDYLGQTSLLPLYDSSGYLLAGCLTKGPISNVITGSCFVPRDTILINPCPQLFVRLPVALFAGYSFYSAMPFVAANAFDPSAAITTNGVYYAYYNSGPGCSDTIRIQVYVNPCPDIDDDDDGIPDVVEGGGTDPSADADSDGTQNFLDPDFAGFVDSNSDGVNDNFDWDHDGIPNHLDLDADNDGIPDVVESYGVDADGDGRIDNYTDTDNDGLSQNVDANNTGVASSGNGLGAMDFDGDGIANYLDLDSDNDGIPDILEAGGADTNNDGIVDSYTDTDGDGYHDGVDGDVGNNGASENSSNSLLLTGSDGNNDGRADSYVYKNVDRDARPNPYDLDSDADGIADIIEAGFTDTDYNGRIDGTLNAKGWSTVVSGFGSITLPNRDGNGGANVYDIDADNDGIPDNIEGQLTATYALPLAIDTDGDGIDDAFDNIAGFGGRGITPCDIDGDTWPDYLDLDTDGDGMPDLLEGNDLNLNSFPDDNIVLAGTDTDGDGLDDFFDLNNSSAEGTSNRMGNGGSFTGDATPGSKTVVQKSTGGAYDRDWRAIEYILALEFIEFKASLQNKKAQLKWTVANQQGIDHYVVERSTDRNTYHAVSSVQANTSSDRMSYQAYDDISNSTATVFYYKVRAVFKDGKQKTSSVLTLNTKTDNQLMVRLSPVPVQNESIITVQSKTSGLALLTIVDMHGRTVVRFDQNIQVGVNQFNHPGIATLSKGVYYLNINLDGTTSNCRFNIVK